LKCDNTQQATSHLSSDGSYAIQAHQGKAATGTKMADKREAKREEKRENQEAAIYHHNTKNARCKNMLQWR